VDAEAQSANETISRRFVARLSILDMTHTEQLAHHLIFRVAEKCFDGRLPIDADAVVTSMLVNLFADASDEQLEEIAACLYVAANKYIEMQYVQLPL
jgi:hypothetical protein